MTASPEFPRRAPRRRRVEAERSIAAILDAATRILREEPEASVEDIAKAAGLSRQTVYAHYASREALLDAVVRRATAEVVAAFDAAGLEESPPPVALVRLLDTGWKAIERYPFVWHLPTVSEQDDRERHRPIVERLEQLIRRGQASGDFDPRPSPAWLLAAIMALGNAASGEVATGRMTVEDATSAVRHSVLRLFGIEDSDSTTA